MSERIGDNLNILILDDEKDICSYSKEFFKRRGFKVSTAMTAKAALKAVEGKKMHIAILDIHLAKGIAGGIGVLKTIREKQPACRCIMLTRDDDKDNIKLTKDLGAVDYLVKPLTLFKLDSAIQRIAGRIRKGEK